MASAEHIFESLVRDIEHGIGGLLHRGATIGASSTPLEGDMSLITELKNDAKALASKFEGVDEAAADKLSSLEGNPVVDALLAAAHVPAQALSIAVDVLQGLATIYPKPDAAPAAPEAPADPAVPAAEAA